MTDPVRAALHDLATQVQAGPLDLVALRSDATRRRRSRRLSAAAAVAVVLAAAPLAWSAVPRGVDAITQQPASEAHSTDGGPGLVSGRFSLRYAPPAYDEPAAERALERCTALPGLLLTGVDLSLPPAQGFAFAGTTTERDEAQRCLTAVPAALPVDFRPDPAFVPVALLGAGQRSSGPLEVQAGEPRPAPAGWVEHDLVITNTSDQRLDVDTQSLARVLDDQVYASTGSCAYAGPAAPVCRRSAGVTLQQGESATVTVRLERDLPGLQRLQPGELELLWQLPFAAVAGEGVITVRVTYGVLSTATTTAPAPRAPEPAPASVPPPRPPVPAPSGAPQVVTVFFSRSGGLDPCTDLVPVSRTVPATDAVASAALRELFRGPTVEEQGRGAQSVFSPQSADLLRSLRVEDGIAYLDLTERLLTLTNASSSCGGSATFGAIESTLRQFPTVREVAYAVEGDPEAFTEFSQRTACPERVLDRDRRCPAERFRG